MRTLKLIAVLVAAALAPAALAQKAEVAGAIATAPGQANVVGVVTANATISAIDAATRTVQLTFPDGKTRSIELGAEVRNFDQLKVGDKVKAKYVESLALELRKDGKAVVGRTENTTLDRAKPGAKPGGVVRHEMTVVADVVNVDAVKKVVSVKNDRGEVIDLDVQDPAQLALIKKGDKVQATYTVAVAVSVEPAAKGGK